MASLEWEQQAKKHKRQASKIFEGRIRALKRKQQQQNLLKNNDELFIINSKFLWGQMFLKYAVASIYTLTYNVGNLVKYPVS